MAGTPIIRRTAALVAVLALIVAACGGGTATRAPSAAQSAAASSGGSSAEPSDAVSAEPSDAESAEPSDAESAEPSGSGPTGAASCEGATANQFFDQAECEEQLRLRGVTAEGDPATPWLQALEPDFRDTAEFASAEEGNWKICFSNAGVDNPWRVVGFNTMEHEVAIQQAAGLIAPGTDGFVHVVAEGSDEKQISDIADLLTQDCDALIVSPNTTEALTPAVESACQAGLPVIVFDRGVNTDCTVTFIKPIGGYAFGADAAEFLVENVPAGGNIVALRILPGVDVLETRFLAAEAIFNQNGLTILDSEFTEGDPANTKTIIADILAAGDTIDGVWMDAGATSVGAIEAFEDAALPVPPITGEDQNDFLLKWQADGLTAVAPTYPTYQWRTPILAAVMILQGEQVPANWNLPQPKITAETLDQYAAPDLPPLFYPLCGCQEMDGFPEDWQGT